MKEKDLQACLNQMVPDMLSRFHGQSRTYWDTSGKLENMPIVLCDNVADIVTNLFVLSCVITDKMHWAKRHKRHRVSVNWLYVSGMCGS